MCNTLSITKFTRRFSNFCYITEPLTQRTKIMSSCLRYLLIIASLCSLADANNECSAFKPVGAKCRKNMDCGNSTVKGWPTCSHLCGAEMKCCRFDDFIPPHACKGCPNRGGFGCVGRANECCSGQCIGGGIDPVFNDTHYQCKWQ